MKTLPLKNLFLSNASLAVISLLLGYSFWHIASFNQVITTTVTVPLCFTVSDEYKVTAPETIDVELMGRRADFYALDTSALAAHINIEMLSSGKHDILIKNDHLFLPHTITITRYKPSNPTITLNKKQINQGIING